MLFPIGDDDRSLSGPAYITILLVAANVLIFLIQLANPAVSTAWAVIPREIATGQDLVGVEQIVTSRGVAEIRHFPGPTPIYLTLLFAMFMHGGVMHILGNMIYLWIFGDNVEHRFGAFPFLLFYLISGLVGSLAHVAVDPGSTVPSLGASGAISGVLGAYLVLFPRNRVHAVVFYMIVSIPAIAAIGIWIVFQFINGLGSIVYTSQTGGIAYAAHIGGFFAGVVLALIMRVVIREEKVNVFTRFESADSRRWW
ncbi:MAG TPA: rhomboid family intramembrane serine protease [Acidobacteriota bacterium]|jgi:membrane associated rhomboid family serine protease|nr:rhomboid family intramembrane serine protease [Acidobacteriota bacterium]